MMKRKLTVFGLVVVALLIAGCGNPVRENVEKSVAEMLPEVIGPADSYSVRVYGPTLRLAKGKLDGLDIVGKNVRLPNGITASELFVTIRDLRVDTSSKEIKEVGTTDFKAVLSKAELNRYVIKRYPDVPELSIDPKKGYLTVSARPGVSVVRTTVQVNAGLVIKEERKLVLDLKRLKVGPVTAPGFATEYIESKFDTIFDANDLGFDAKIRSVDIEPGGLTLNGDLDLMKAVEKQRQKPAGP